MSTSYSTVNALDEFTIIGGTDFTLRFSITDEDGLPVDLTSSTLLLKIAPYGQPGSVITTLTGTIGATTDIAEYVLPATTSEGMVGGKYMYQPIIEDSVSKIHRPKQGIFLLVQAIGNFADVIDVPSSAYYIYGTGTNAYSSTNTTITSYYAGLSIILYVQNTNTVNATLELAGVVGTKGLMKFNSSGSVVSLIANDLIAERKYFFVYDGTQWIHIGVMATDGLVTGGDSHDHSGGDGAQISHTNLSNVGTNTHAQIDTFIGTTVPTTYAPLASPVLTGNPTAPTPTTGDDDTSIATTAFVNAEITNDRPYSDTNPVMDGVAAQGVSTKISRQDHVHPTDTSRAALASPTFTGTPAAPTASVTTNTTQLATTAHANSKIMENWAEISDTWTRTGNHTFTVSGDVTTTYTKGALVRYKDGGAYEYGVIYSSVYSSPNTTVTLITNSNYAMAAATITDKAISRAANPAGWPGAFNYSATVGGYLTPPSNTVYRFSTIGNLITVFVRELTDGVSNSTGTTISAPCAAATITNMRWIGTNTYVDNSTPGTVLGTLTIPSAGTDISAATNGTISATTWTNTGNKRVASGNITYEF